MIRLATVNDYPAVSDLLNTYPSFSSRPKELMTMILSASSKLPFMFTMKIAVVVNSNKRIVGCILLNEGPYFLRAETVCIAEKMNWQLMLTHIVEFLRKYAEAQGYPGFSITLQNKDYAEFVKTMNPTFGFVDCHRAISELRRTPADDVKSLSSVSIAEFNIQRKHLAKFADIEYKIPIYMATHDYSTFKDVLDRYQGISSDRIDKHSTDFKDFIDFLTNSTNTSQYLSESLDEKLVIAERGRAVGFACFKTTGRHTQSIEVTDLFVLPSYVNTDIPKRLLLAVGRYGANRGAKFMCGRYLEGDCKNYIRSFYESIGTVSDEYTSVFVFDGSDESSAVLEDTLTNPDTSKTSVFSG